MPINTAIGQLLIQAWNVSYVQGPIEVVVVKIPERND
jgi:hypothetical protein